MMRSVQLIGKMMTGPVCDGIVFGASISLRRRLDVVRPTARREDHVLDGITRTFSASPGVVFERGGVNGTVIGLARDRRGGLHGTWLSPWTVTILIVESLRFVPGGILDLDAIECRIARDCLDLPRETSGNRPVGRLPARSRSASCWPA